jgi:exodeoxyribonuclease-3
VVEAHLAKIDVEGGFFPTGQGEVTSLDRQVVDEAGQLGFRIAHRASVSRGQACRPAIIILSGHPPDNGGVRIATWNINSIRTRVDRVVDFLIDEDVDVLLLQETKCRDDQFPLEKFDAIGYEVFHWGLNQWNGVAVVSRLPLSDGEQGFPGMPGFDKTGVDPKPEARAVAATIGSLRLWSVYGPNGRALDDPHMPYKLSWLDALSQHIRHWSAEHPDMEVVVGGDFNIAPEPRDVGDPSFVDGISTHVSAAERETLSRFLDTATLQDLVRPLIPEGYTYWDYTQGKFPKNHGMRIDFLYGSQGVGEQVSAANIARDQRTGEQPSDHVPVIVDLLDDEDDFDQPMVF